MYFSQSLERPENGCLPTTHPTWKRGSWEDLQRMTQYSQSTGFKAFDIGDFVFHMGEKIMEGSCHIIWGGSGRSVSILQMTENMGQHTLVEHLMIIEVSATGLYFFKLLVGLLWSSGARGNNALPEGKLSMLARSLAVLSKDLILYCFFMKLIYHRALWTKSMAAGLATSAQSQQLNRSLSVSLCTSSCTAYCCVVLSFMASS